VFVMRDHRGIAMAQQSGDLLLGETHPPSVQNEIVLFVFEVIHNRYWLAITLATGRNLHRREKLWKTTDRHPSL